MNVRHKARRKAVQALYQWFFNPVPTEELLAGQLAEINRKKIDVAYLQDLLQGVADNVVVLDELLQPHLDRALDELSPVELAVLRLACYELKQRQDVPYKVVINEAIELTKVFGTVDGFKYVNGVLDKLAPSLRPFETK